MRPSLLCVLALLAAAPARAAEFHVDPAQGSDAGDGSAARPWRSIQWVVDNRLETRDWASLPWTGKALAPVNPGAPVKAGDTVWLRSGDHGALAITGAYNTAPVTIAAEAGATPRFSGVRVRSASQWVLRGLWVSPSHGAAPANRAIVSVEDHDWTGPVSDVVLDGLEVYTVPGEDVWATPADWDAGAWDGILADGDRAVVRGCAVRNVSYGIAVTGRGARVEHNLVDGFSGDGLRGLGDDEVFEYNLVRNSREVNADHRDGFQSWTTGAGGVGTGVVRNVTLRGNVIVGHQGGVRFAGTLQGIGCFDGTYQGWLVENNVVITDHWHGISFYGAEDVRLVNNTVLDLVPGSPGPPWVMITAHKSGTPSQGGAVANNLAATVSVEGTGVAEAGNLLLPADVSAWFADPAGHDLRLREGSPAIDRGAAAQAPAADADGVARPAGAGVDAGAFEYAPGAVRPPGGLAGPGRAPAGGPAPGSLPTVRAGGCGHAGGGASALLASLVLLGARLQGRGRRPPPPA